MLFKMVLNTISDIESCQNSNVSCHTSIEICQNSIESCQNSCYFDIELLLKLLLVLKNCQ